MLHNDKMRASQRSRRSIVKGPKPPVVKLSEAEQQALEKLIKAHSTEQQLVPRARIVLAAGQGLNNAQIARELHITTDMARQWRDRWLLLQTRS
jgi:DNA-binding NarL/FixJ family response regulator